MKVKVKMPWPFANSMFIVVNESPSYVVTLQSDSNVEETYA
jgi:hypothetical protein